MATLSSRNSICVIACLGSRHDHQSRRRSSSSSSSSLPPQPKPRPVNQNINVDDVPRKTKSTSLSSSSSPKRRKPKKASIAQIERAIGAGTFRDSDPCDVMEQSEMSLDGILPVTGGRFEGELEKKVRETSENLSSKTEAAFRSSERRVLMVLVQFILPAWTFFLLLAAGVINLPFNIPFIHDLLL